MFQLKQKQQYRKTPTYYAKNYARLQDLFSVKAERQVQEKHSKRPPQSREKKRPIWRRQWWTAIRQLGTTNSYSEEESMMRKEMRRSHCVAHLSRSGQRSLRTLTPRNRNWKSRYIRSMLFLREGRRGVDG